MQYLVGLPGYQMQVPFVPSLFVEIRKRMGQEVFEVFHGAVVDAVERERSKSKASRSDGPDDTDPPPSGTEKSGPEMKPTHQGKLILDATVAEQAIRYPTDLSLLNEAREFSEQIIDRLYAKSALTKKPRSYRQQAR